MDGKEFYKLRNFETEHPDFYNLINEDGVYIDIGCANGNGIKIVEHNNNIKKSYGIDVYKSFPDAIVKDMNKDKLPFKNNSIDVVSSFEVIEHINNTEHYIQEIKRVLKDDGTLYLSTPNLAWWFNRILLIFGYQPANTEVDFNHSMFGKPKVMKDNKGSGHIHVFTKKAMREFLKYNGFKIINEVPNNANYESKWYFNIIDKLFSNMPSMAIGYVYICKRV